MSPRRADRLDRAIACERLTEAIEHIQHGRLFEASSLINQVDDVLRDQCNRQIVGAVRQLPATYLKRRFS